jgi:hypothetical protein
VRLDHLLSKEFNTILVGPNKSLENTRELLVDHESDGSFHSFGCSFRTPDRVEIAVRPLCLVVKECYLRLVLVRMNRNGALLVSFFCCSLKTR